ncbi:hypothetical protein BCR44DRAFT_1510888 [Catenaria anguillulae PL171]|uniref:Uncharacterized protein n=1 Tax=Catenaria anguillulae PL171 TaxID=765915 RepID=A0A1Y2HXQ1_9FUNG|nr:hypothetical protein BCR44DRAFT_1510888 [Catenaria anguillulae PL171]
MTTPDPTPLSPLPTLPTHLVELILTWVPHLSEDHVPIYSVLNVLPQAIVPSVYASLVVNDLYLASGREPAVKSALVSLFADPALDGQAKTLLKHMRNTLSMTYLLDPIMFAITKAGNMKMFEHVMTLVDMDEICAESLLHHAARFGRLDVLKWWRKHGYSLGDLTRDAIEAAATAGHVAVLKWWHALAPPVELDFTDSSIVLDMVDNGQLAALKWFKASMDPALFVFTDEHWVLASERGHDAILTFAKSSRIALPDSSCVECIDKAAANGHVCVLDWWYKNVGRNKSLAYTVDAMDLASAGGHVHVLDWFSKSGLELRFTPAAVRLARAQGHNHVVQWWSQCRLYTSMAADFKMPLNALTKPETDFVMLCAFGFFDVLANTKMAAQPRSTLHRALDVACREGQVSILQLLGPRCDMSSHPNPVRLQQIAVEYNQPAALQWCLRNAVRGRRFSVGGWVPHIMSALKRGHIDVLEVLLAGDFLDWEQYGDKYVKAASSGGHVRSLEFLNVSVAATEKWDCDTIAFAFAAGAENGHVSVLNWLLQNGCDLSDTDIDWDWTVQIDKASASGHVGVLKWWSENGLDVSYTERALWGAIKNQHAPVIQWWIDSGLVVGEHMLEMLQSAIDSHENVR